MFDKNKRKAINRMLLSYSWKIANHFIKVAPVRQTKWKKSPKTNISFNFFHLSSSTAFNYISIKTTHSLTFFSNVLSFDSRVFNFFVFCILSNKLDNILCGICVSFKSRNLKFIFKTIIQVSSTGIFLGLWSRGGNDLV